MMFRKLTDHIQQYLPLSEEDCSLIPPFFKKMEVKKKENLLVEGGRCTYNYFVEKGLLRMFFINEKGVEQITQFAIEGGG